MEEIWKLFENKTYSGDMLIKDAYCNVHKANPAWVVDTKGLTLQQWADRICDELEAEGMDLQTTPMDAVFERFVLYDIKLEPPKEYKQLVEAKEQTESTLEMIEKLEVSDEGMLQQLRDNIDLLVSKMKELS